MKYDSGYFDVCTVHFYHCFYYNQQMQINITTLHITTVSLCKYINLNVSTFICHHQRYLHLCLAKLHKFLKLKLLKKQFHIKILFNRGLVIKICSTKIISLNRFFKIIF
jgi:hypothetical protein